MKIMKMELDGIPNELVDILVQEISFDAIQLAPKYNPLHVLYSHLMLKRLFDTKHNNFNPYTHKTLYISNDIPHVELKR